MASNDSELQSPLMENTELEHTPTTPTFMMVQLVEKLAWLSISNLPQILKVPQYFDSSSIRPEEVNLESHPGYFAKVSNPFPLRIHNMPFSYQDMFQNLSNLMQHR